MNLPSCGLSVDGLSCWSFLCAGLWKTSSSEQERSIGEPYVKNPRLIPRWRWYGMETGILVYSDGGVILKSFGILLMREGGGKSERRILATENGKFWAMLKLFPALTGKSVLCSLFIFVGASSDGREWVHVKMLHTVRTELHLWIVKSKQKSADDIHTSSFLKNEIKENSNNVWIYKKPTGGKYTWLITTVTAAKFWC